MIKVITYGTYDLLHYGHVRLLERAKALGDYLIVGITTDDFDKSRGKINVQQSLTERIETIRALGIADEIIVEEYEGQKIDDIRRMGVDIFTVGSDWIGKLDYLNEFCKVVYLPRTEGVSSSEIRQEQQKLKLGLVGNSTFLSKFGKESLFVNGIELAGICTDNIEKMSIELQSLPLVTQNFVELLDNVDAVYLHSNPVLHYVQIKTALEKHKHVLCESPITLNQTEMQGLIEKAHNEGCILQEGIKTAYSTAFSRMLLLLKSGKIGKVISVDATCTSLNMATTSEGWTSICSWGPVALLPIFKILGTEYRSKQAVASFVEKQDIFTKVDFLYPSAVASLKVGKGVKSEGELIVSGTNGYVYIPAPWWKTDYFEIRYENSEENKRYFYQLDGDGIQNEIVAFLQAINNKRSTGYIEENISIAISRIMEDFYSGKDVSYI
jgi:choline-phosphate cytidylyltransferase